MFRLGADLKVYLHREPIDFRAGINSLAVLVQETMELDPFTPAVFAFCNRRRDRMKLLLFDRSTKKLSCDQERIRTCLKCKGPFLSWGAGNRVCQSCKSKDSD